MWCGVGLDAWQPNPPELELGLYTDSVSALTFEEALDLAVEIGARGIEVAAGGQSAAPHLDIDQLLSDAGARRRFRGAFEDRGLRIAALNCSAWPLHPVKGATERALIEKVIRLAPLVGVKKVVTMSGTPGDGGGASFLNWVWYPWPEEAVVLRERQWEEAISLWRELAALASHHGVERIAMELHPLHLVYNVPTLLRMREAVGETIGANMDPSHLFWQQMDPMAVVEELGTAIHHVHLKDTELIADQLALAGVLDGRPFEQGAKRAWVFRTVGRSHGAEFWSGLIAALARVGYDDVLCIENEDAEQLQEEGVREAAAFIRPLLPGRL